MKKYLRCYKDEILESIKNSTEVILNAINIQITSVKEENKFLREKISNFMEREVLEDKISSEEKTSHN